MLWYIILKIISQLFRNGKLFLAHELSKNTWFVGFELWLLHCWPLFYRAPFLYCARVFWTTCMLLDLHLLGNLIFLFACSVPRNVGSMNTNDCFLPFYYLPISAWCDKGESGVQSLARVISAKTWWLLLNSQDVTRQQSRLASFFHAGRWSVSPKDVVSLPVWALLQGH